MARLCISSFDLKKTLSKNGSYTFEGDFNAANMAYEITEVIKPSQIELATTSSQCLKRLQFNLSDISITSSAVGGSYYYVPVVSGDSAPCILSGYEVNEYIRGQSSRSLSQLGLLKNLKSFDASIYLVITGLCLTIFLVEKIYSTRIRKLSKGQGKKRPKGKVKKKSSLKRTHFRILQFLLTVMFFLVATAFLNLYSTIQVVTYKPYVITDYESLIQSNITIMLAMSTKVKEYLHPTVKNVENNDVTFRFFNYFNSRNIHMTTFIKNYFKSASFIDFIFFDYNWIKTLIGKKYVLFTHQKSCDHIKYRLCGLSTEHEFFQVFSSIDPSQRRILVGESFRT